MRKILALLLSFFTFMAMINPAYAVLISAGDFNASGSARIYNDEYALLYSYTAPSGKSIMRIQGTIDTSYEYNNYYLTFYVYDASGNLLTSSCANEDNRSVSFNSEFNVSSITIKAKTSYRSCGLDWSAKISLGADVADNTYAIQARDAAKAAKISADGAKTSADTASARALNSYNAVSNTNGNTITAVRDAGGTVLSEARQAKTNSQNAYDEAHSASTKIDNLNTAITNIANSIGVDKTSPSITIKTLSGAMATSGSSIQAVLDITDPDSTTFTYSTDGTNYSPVPDNRIISLPVSSPGANPIFVWVKDQSGNTSATSIIIRKL